MVVIAPTMAHQTVLLHRHIRSGQDFQEACAASLTTLNWCTGVLLNTQQLKDVLKVVMTDQELHKGRILISEQLKGSPQVQRMMGKGWRISVAMPLQLHRVWKNTRHAPKRKVRIHVLEQGEDVPRAIQRGHRRTFVQVLRQSVDGSADAQDQARPLIVKP